MRKSLLLTVFVCLVVCCVTLYAEQWVGDSMSSDIETPHPYPRASAGDLVWSHTIYQKGASWVKLHFSDFNLNDEDYLELVDMYGTVIETVKGSDMNAGSNKFRVKRPTPDKNMRQGMIDHVAFWGPAIDGNEITINLYRGSEKKNGWGFSIDEIGVGAVPIFADENISYIESICGSDDKTRIKCASSFYQNLGEAVGRMLFQKSGSWYVCTGFLCSCNSSHFLTNEHCITSQTVVNTLQVRFKYRYSACTGSSLDSYSTYYGDDFVTDSTSYDFCLLTLTGSPQNTYGYLGLINGNPVSGEDIYIIQHPGGRPQEIGFGTVYSTYANGGKDFSYYVDTEGGSSGSPVFAEYEDEVLGLHHYGGCPNSAVKMNYIFEYITGYLGCN